MCGIVGFVGGGDLRLIKKMSQRLLHRGPDDNGLWFDEKKHVYLAHRRLAIVDIAGGRQPMVSDDGRYVLVYNGEIYNHRELREELLSRGHRFRTDHSDTETLLIAYREWGKDVLTKLNGMWAFAVYDQQEERLFLARDRLGQKPLYYASTDHSLVFASELDALTLHPHIDRRVSNLALHKYFAYGYIPSPYTLYQGGRKLPGGSYLEWSDGVSHVGKYWEYVLEPMAEEDLPNEDDLVDELSHLLATAVERRTMSDVPMGVFLSGGVDSSGVALHLSRGKSHASTSTFSMGFENASFDETQFASLVAEQIGSCHHPFCLSSEDIVQEAQRIAASLDEPMGDSSFLPTWFLCRETSRHVKVVLGGDGADELFAGYDPFRALSYAEWYDRLIPRPIHHALCWLAALLPVHHNYMTFSFRLNKTLKGLSFPRHVWSPVWLSAVDPHEWVSLFEDPLPMEEVYEEAITLWNAHSHLGLADQTSMFFTKIYFEGSILSKVDRASMLHSLEVRAPFLDLDLINFARRLPHSYKYRGGTTKYLLRKTLARDGLPSRISTRRKKGFGAPVGQWFAQKRFGVSSDMDVSGIRKGYYERKLASHCALEEDSRLYLWNQWVLDAYLREKG